jgi:peroxiredoxin
VPDLTVLYVMSGNQVDPKAIKFIRDHRLPFIFLIDADHRVIDQFGVYNNEFHEAIEEGVPHPATYVLDRDGIIRLKDTRKDFRVWLSAAAVEDVLARNP